MPAPHHLESGTRRTPYGFNTANCAMFTTGDAAINTATISTAVNASGRN